MISTDRFPREVEQTREEEDFVEIEAGWPERLLGCVTFLLSGVAAYSVYEGAPAFLPHWWHHVGMAVVSFCLQIGTYLYLHARYPYATSEGRKAMRWIMALSLPFIFCISTLMGVVFFGGDTAIRNYMTRVTDTSQQELTRVYAGLKEEAKLGAALDVFEKQFTTLAGQELKGGISGTAGAGNVTSTISSASSMLKEMKAAVGTSQKNVDALYTQARENLEKMQAIIYSPGGQASASNAFAVELNSFNTAITKLYAASASDVIRRIAPGLSGVGAVATVSGSGNADLAARQNSAIDKVKASVKDTEEAINRFLAQVMSSPKTQSFSATDKFAAFFSNLTVGLAMALAEAVAVDFAPILFMFAAAVVIDDERRKMMRRRRANNRNPLR